MPKKSYTNLPDNYPVCQHADCQMSATCLHHLAYTTLLEKEEYLCLINPAKCTKTDTCPYYRNNDPVTYARGFTNFQKHMYPAQYQKFMSICISHFSRNTYFERRRGDYPLPPSEQQIILDALRQAGVTEEMQFDSYEQQINWYD